MRDSALRVKIKPARDVAEFVFGQDGSLLAG
jgi:hypothetical protein